MTRPAKCTPRPFAPVFASRDLPALPRSRLAAPEHPLAALFGSPEDAPIRRLDAARAAARDLLDRGILFAGGHPGLVCATLPDPRGGFFPVLFCRLPISCFPPGAMSDHEEAQADAVFGSGLEIEPALALAGPDASRLSAAILEAVAGASSPVALAGGVTAAAATAPREIAGLAAAAESAGILGWRLPPGASLYGSRKIEEIFSVVIPLGAGGGALQPACASFRAAAPLAAPPSVVGLTEGLADLHVQLYRFADNEERLRTEEDVLEDLRFESDVSAVCAAAARGRDHYSLVSCQGLPALGIPALFDPARLRRILGEGYLRQDHPDAAAALAAVRKGEDLALAGPPVSSERVARALFTGGGAGPEAVVVEPDIPAGLVLARL